MRPAREQEKFRTLFEEGWRPLRAYVMRRTSDQAGVDDIVAEVFSIAWRRLGEVPEGREVAWLYGVARNVLLNTRRGLARRNRLVERLGSQAVVDARVLKTRATSPERFDRLDKALEQLSDAELELLRLAFWEGISHAEISIAMDCSENAVGVRLHRIRKKLASLIGSEQDKPAPPKSEGDLAEPQSEVR